MEIVVILFNTARDAPMRQRIMDHIYQLDMVSVKLLSIGLKINKSAGTLTINGEEHKFTPVLDLISDDLLPIVRIID